MVGSSGQFMTLISEQLVSLPALLLRPQESGALQAAAGGPAPPERLCAGHRRRRGGNRLCSATSGEHSFGKLLQPQTPDCTERQAFLIALWPLKLVFG